MSITASHLVEIEVRALHAPRGKWGYHVGDNFAVVAVDLEETATGYAYRQHVAHLKAEDFWDNPANEDEDEDRAAEQLADSAEFIACSRDDVLTLVAEVQRLQAELDATRRQLDDATGMTQPAVAADLEAAGHRLRTWRAANKPA